MVNRTESPSRFVTFYPGIGVTNFLVPKFLMFLGGLGSHVVFENFSPIGDRNCAVFPSSESKELSLNPCDNGPE